MSLLRSTFLIGMLIITQVSFAETCPSINDVKRQAFHQWKLYDSDDDSLLSADAKDRFAEKATRFTLAEWVGNQQKGAIRCYYSDNNGSNLNAYLTKKSLSPKDTHHYWYEVSGSMHCAAGMKRCEFTHQNAQLAKS